MQNLTQNYSPTNNFWEYNTQFTTVQPFKKLYSSDKSRGKKVSSDLMWAIALINHPKSDMFHIPNVRLRLSMDLLKVNKKDVDSFWDANKAIEEAFVDAVLTQAEKSLIAWENRLKDRDRFLKEQKYHFGYTDEDGIEHKDNTKALDDMLAKTGKLYDELFKIQKSLEEDDVRSGNKSKGYDSKDAGI